MEIMQNLHLIFLFTHRCDTVDCIIWTGQGVNVFYNVGWIHIEKFPSVLSQFCYHTCTHLCIAPWQYKKQSISEKFGLWLILFTANHHVPWVRKDVSILQVLVNIPFHMLYPHCLWSRYNSCCLYLSHTRNICTALVLPIPMSSHQMLKVENT